MNLKAKKEMEDAKLFWCYFIASVLIGGLYSIYFSESFTQSTGRMAGVFFILHITRIISLCYIKLIKYLKS